MSDVDLKQDIERLQKRLEREKNARIQAETLLEQKSKELYDINQTLNLDVRLFEATVINAKDSVMITNADLENGPVIEFVNRALCNLTGYREDELIGQTPRIFQGKDTDRTVLNELKNTLKSGKAFQGELKNYGKNGDAYWLNISVVPICDAEGNVTHYTAIERDITEQKRNAVLLREEIEKARTANKAKTEFLANMSHELRTPMNGIIGLSDLLMDTNLNEEQKQSVEAINKSSENLLILLNDILDSSKIEAGEMTLENIPFNLKVIIDDTVRLLKPKIDEKKLGFRCHFSPALPIGMVGDSTRLQQILINLMGNALKFTDRGEISVNFSREPNNMMKVTIDDTGIGIPSDKVDHIFVKFSQADETTSRRYGGTGLGLTICKSLVNLMGGDIGVESVVGQGSSFWFTLPIVEANIELQKASENSRDVPKVDFGNAHIMVVDDHPINLMLARKLLKKIGVQRIQIVDNGQEAFEYTQVNMYDAILMDCQMPGMDGFQTTEAIRKMHKGQALHTPIIAVTANAMKGDREKCLQAGMDDYISKPIDPNTLSQTLQKWIDVETSTATQALDDELLDIDSIKPVTMDNNSADLEPALNLEELRDMFGDDPDDEAMLFDVFFESTQESLENLGIALCDHDNEKWRKAAHKLKGSAANMRANPLAEICSQAEKECDADPDLKKEFLAKMQKQIDAIQSYRA